MKDEVKPLLPSAFPFFLHPFEKVSIMKASFKAVGRVLGLLLVFALCAGAALAQQAGASLRGQVADEFGGVIVGATITVTDAAGKAKSVVTDSETRYLSGPAVAMVCRRDVLSVMLLSR